ncbi:MAG: hypothetical protein MUE67_02760 [Anaerolineales bacterium]|jgi:hypothetical protein|nr:hypothetical protein [Anaerolineales bacterium]
MESLCQQHSLFTDQDHLIRVPFLIKGRLVLPPEIDRRQVEAAFASLPAEVHHVYLPGAQALRQLLIDPVDLQPTGAYQYQLLSMFNPAELIETDFDRLLAGPYSLSVADLQEYLSLIACQLRDHWTTVERVRDLSARSSLLPRAYLDGAFAALQSDLDPAAALRMIDRELSAWGLPGSRFLEGWVAAPGEALPGLAPFLAQGLPGAALCPPHPMARTLIRAMPTRQLHITAGNVPQAPLISALRLILTKSAGVIKLPAEASLPGSLLALAAYAAAPDHPLTQNLSVVYWPGGDESIERTLLAPGAFDRVVVWGAPEAVASLQSRAGFTRLVSFNPRYGISLIGREAFANDLGAVAFLGAQDVLIYNQQACNASLVHYIEAGFESACEYARRLQAALAEWDVAIPQVVLPAQRGQLKRLRRGKYNRAEWLLNLRAGEYASGVVVIPEEFDLLDHPMARLVVVRPVARLEDALPYLHAGVAMAGIYPEHRRLALLDAIAARGVSSIFPLGQCERVFAGMPQDGMLVLNQLVDWKSG